MLFESRTYVHVVIIFVEIKKNGLLSLSLCLSLFES